MLVVSGSEVLVDHHRGAPLVVRPATLRPASAICSASTRPVARASRCVPGELADRTSRRGYASWRLTARRRVRVVVPRRRLAQWHATHTHCPRCGAPTQVSAGGAERRCPVDGSTHFPRVDPAVIVLVTDADDRALLGRQEAWPVGRFSTLAGFVEPGETAEQAVRREVAEEAGDRGRRCRSAGHAAVAVSLVADDRGRGRSVRDHRARSPTASSSPRHGGSAATTCATPSRSGERDGPGRHLDLTVADRAAGTAATCPTTRRGGASHADEAVSATRARGARRRRRPRVRQRRPVREPHGRHQPGAVVGGATQLRRAGVLLDVHLDEADATLGEACFKRAQGPHHEVV